MNWYPFLNWVGGKTRLLPLFHQALPPQFTTMDEFTYVEPFLSGGAMLFHMLLHYPNITQAIMNDRNQDLIFVIITSLTLADITYSSAELNGVFIYRVATLNKVAIFI